MAVPTQSALHRPLLEIAASNSATEPFSHRRFGDAIVDRLSLTEKDVQERTSTNASRLMTNLGFALSRLRRAGLLSSPTRGLFVVSSEGIEFLRSHTGQIRIAQLDQMYERKRTGKANVISPPQREDELEEDPLKKMEDGNHAIRENLTSELLDSLLGLPADGFERLTLRLLERLGYGKGKVVGRSGDDGIDVIINQDALGLEKVYVQAKRWRQSVGSGEIRNFSGSLQVKGAVKGVFVTTSHFTKSAKDTATTISLGNQTVLLIDGQELAALMIDRDVGVITEQTYAIKKLDENYFAEI